MQLFEYRIVELPPLVTPHDGTFPAGYMPQRGVSHNLEAVAGRIQWVDAVPFPAPSIEAARDYVRSLKSFDNRTSEGRVVYSD
jgi:hypothetical protein